MKQIDKAKKNMNFHKNIYFNFHKYLNLFILFIILIFKNNNHSSFEKVNFMSYAFFAEGLNNFNINEIKNDKQRELYLKNHTEFFLRSRTEFLLRHNVIYKDTKLITFQDKLNWLIIHESPLYKSFIVDKIRLREYSKKILGKDLCPPIYKIYDDANEINFNELPNKFVLKLNHASAMNIICENKSKINKTKIINQLNHWKTLDNGFENKEFQYIYINRKIFAEKYLGKNLIEYDIFCFNGEPKFIRVRKYLSGKSHIKIHNIYNINWELNEIDSRVPGFVRDPNIIIKKPKNLKLMLKYSKLLSREFVFVRVDLYEINNRVYLGELTFSPTNAQMKWKDKEQSIKIGNFMDLKKIKKYLYNK